MQDQINNLVNNVNLFSNWDKMYTAEAKVGKDDGVSSGNEL